MFYQVRVTRKNDIRERVYNCSKITEKNKNDFVTVCLGLDLENVRIGITLQGCFQVYQDDYTYLVCPLSNTCIFKKLKSTI